MVTTIALGDVSVELTRREVKNVHLAVHPPDGRVTLVAPTGTRLDVARAYAVTKLPWIREQRAKLSAQAREAPRRFVTRERVTGSGGEGTCSWWSSATRSPA